MSVRIGIGGTSLVARQGREPFLAHLDTVEEQGWDSIWFSDRIVGPGWVLDPIVGMALVAARTKRIRFGTGVLLMSMRSPVLMARALSSVDQMSGGRLIVGVGVGQEATTEYEAMGIAKRDRGRRLDEAVRVMRLLWKQERVTYRGQFLALSDAGINPRPAQPDIPIWIGGRTEAAYRRTGSLGDGWLPTQVTPEDVAAGIARITAHAEGAGRELPDDCYGVQLGCYVVERGRVPEERVRPYLLTRRQDVPLERLHLLGTPDEVVARLREYIDAGATKFVLAPACGFDELGQQLELQSACVLRAFHGDGP